MLEKPDIQDEKIIVCLRDQYGLNTAQLAFLPIGADVNTAVYRAVADNGTPYFVKLRSGPFEETLVTLPKFLGDQGVAPIIAPIPTRTGHLWANLDVFKVVLYPFVEGRNGYQIRLTDQQWFAFGAALKAIHTAAVPPELARSLPRETYSPVWRDIVKAFQRRAKEDVFTEPTAVKMAAFLQDKQDVISELVSRAERFAHMLQTRDLPFVVCHADIHAANILINGSGTLYIVDWDTLILAPKERDLMFVGGAQFGEDRTADQEEALFYQGYGPTQIDPFALAYYRFERIIEDIAAYSEQILATDEGGKDREKGLRHLANNFLPNNTIAMAYRSPLPPE